ncbi:hypothetical protein DUNSADRAFT_11971 [Dunaliella salina]|uniref:Uncharacterized protein n=1 Tax=Dunaliella salina TaxID=3046 RepID=A0ABQ7GC75_DUNSA|nr:hypothetical protein DUNSADRAFT_11971 [Dunaliella salina]|eukprot:KAF5832214.1 hypothetical protein DUNSADRAFT_11971 [Dunaliella salina]
MDLSTYNFHAAMAVEGQELQEDRVMACMSCTQEEAQSSYRVHFYITDGAHALSWAVGFDVLDQYCLGRSLTNPGDPPRQILGCLEQALISNSCRLKLEGGSFEHPVQAAVVSRVQVPGFPRPIPIRLPTEEGEYLVPHPAELQRHENLRMMVRLCDSEASAKRENVNLRQEVQRLQLRLEQQEQANREIMRQRAEEEEQHARAGPRANLKRPLQSRSGGGGAPAVKLQRLASSQQAAPLTGSQSASQQDAVPFLHPTSAAVSGGPAQGTQGGSQPQQEQWQQNQQSQEILLHEGVQHQASQQQQGPNLGSSSQPGLASQPLDLPSSQQPLLFTSSQAAPPLLPHTAAPSSQPAPQAMSSSQPLINSQGMHALPPSQHLTQLSQQEQHREPASPVQQHAQPHGRGRGRYIPPSRGRRGKPLFGPKSG